MVSSLVHFSLLATHVLGMAKPRLLSNLKEAIVQVRGQADHKKFSSYPGQSFPFPLSCEQRNQAPRCWSWFTQDPSPRRRADKLLPIIIDKSWHNATVWGTREALQSHFQMMAGHDPRDASGVVYQQTLAMEEQCPRGREQGEECPEGIITKECILLEFPLQRKDIGY